MAIQSLFGPSPAEVQEMRRQREEQEILASGGQFGAFAPLYQAGLRFGAQGRQAMAPLMGAQDPMLQKATAIQGVLAKYQGQNLNDPEIMTSIATDLSSVDMEAGLKAAQIARQLVKENKLTTVAPGASVIDSQGNVVFTAPDREKEGAPTTAAERDMLVSLQSKYPDTVEGRAAAANEFAEWKSSFRQKEAAAGVPGVGEVKVTDIASATGIVDRFTKEPKEKIATANAARTQLDLAKKGSGPAFAQLQRQLVKLVGDNQISGAEVRAALGRAGIVGDTIDAVNMFMTGTPSRDKLAAVEQVIDALEATSATSFNEGRVRADTVLKNAKLSPSTVADLIPPPYKTAAQKRVEARTKKAPAVGTVQGGYRFNGGNPADKNNWEKVQ
jgi:hypothetical protein